MDDDVQHFCVLMMDIEDGVTDVEAFDTLDEARAHFAKVALARRDYHHRDRWIELVDTRDDDIKVVDDTRMWP